MIKLKHLALFFTAALTTVSCSEKGLDAGHGRMRIALSADDSAIELTRASLGLNKPTAAEFSLTIMDETGEVVGEWDSIAAYDEATLYNAGNYAAKARYGRTSIEAFETPCFEGTQAFTIVDDQTTSVEITAYVANAIVKIEYTDAFKNYFSDYSFTMTTAAGSQLPFAADETRRAFIQPDRFSMTGSATTQTGTRVPISKEFTNIAAKTLYTIKFDVNAGNVGNATITVSFNDEPVAEIPIDIELNDHL